VIIRVRAGAVLGDVKGPPLGFKPVEVLPCAEWGELAQELGLSPHKCFVIAIDVKAISELFDINFDPASSYFMYVPHGHVYNFVYGKKSFAFDLEAPTTIVLFHQPNKCGGAGRPECDAYIQILPSRFFVVRESVSVETRSGKKRVFVAPEAGGPATRLGWIEAKLCKHSGEKEKCVDLDRIDVFFLGNARVDPRAGLSIKLVSKLMKEEGERAARRAGKLVLDKMGIDAGGKELKDILVTLNRLAQVHSKAKLCLGPEEKDEKCAEVPAIPPRALGAVFFPHPRYGYNVIVDPEARLDAVDVVKRIGEYRVGREPLRLPPLIYGTYKVSYDIFKPPREHSAPAAAAARPTAVQALVSRSPQAAGAKIYVDLVNVLALRGEDVIRIRTAAEEDVRGIRVAIRSLSPGFEAFYRLYFSLKRGEHVDLFLRCIERGLLVGPGLRHQLDALGHALSSTF